MDGVEVKGAFNANVFFQTLGILVAKKRGYNLTLKSLEKAEEWTNVFHLDIAQPPAQDERAASGQGPGKVRAAGERMSAGDGEAK